MGLSIAHKIIKEHLMEGAMETGGEIAIKVDQTLTQDATGTMAYLQFEAVGIPKVRTELSVSYIDHNTLQTGFENMDDHRFLQSIAAKHGIYFSRAGNGICHQVHLERFGIPGKTLLGSDSHTPTGGGIGMMAIGAGGLDVAVAMGGGPFYLTMPRVINIRLTGKLSPWVSAKDVVLEVLRLLTVKGGVGKVIEYSGEGVGTLSVPERATITNMGAETGATTSIFPSDEVTRMFLKAQGREQDWKELKADPDAIYDEVIEIALDHLVPLVARPHMPDNVAQVSQVGPIKVDQVMIGSCTNSSYTDLMKVAGILRGKKVHPDVSLGIAPGSKQVYEMLARNGALADLISAGARIQESACSFCIGMGQAPNSTGVSVRTNNRNFEGRSGTEDALIYLVSPETAAATALTGFLTDPRTLGEEIKIEMPSSFLLDDSMILSPAQDSTKVEVLRGPNIKPLPINKEMPESLAGPILLKVGDNITTDHIMPAGAKILPLRSNIPAISQYVFSGIDPTFAQRALEAGGGFILGGHNYGQGSSREHAALAPMYLGIKAVIAKSFARIHQANLINFGIIPLVLNNPSDYDELAQGAELRIADVRKIVESNRELFAASNLANGKEYLVHLSLTNRQRSILAAGGMLNWVKKQHS